jgi:hypothetical protein
MRLLRLFALAAELVGIAFATNGQWRAAFTALCFTVVALWISVMGHGSASSRG